MDDPIETPEPALEFDELPDYTHIKRKIIVGLVIFEGLSPMLGVTIGRGVTTVLTIFVIDMCIVWWVNYDKLEFGERLTTGWRVALFLFSAIALPIYFFQTRGWPRAMKSIGKCILLYLLMIVLQVVVGLMLYTIING